MGWWQQLMRAVGLSEVSVPPAQGANTGQPVSQSFDVSASITAFVQFPWVRACLDAIGTDLTGCRLKVVRGKGAQAEEVDIPDLTRLLENPTSWQIREEWERTLLVHLLLTGNAYVLLVGPAKPTSLPLLHPAQTRVIPGSFGGPEGYEYSANGTMTRYSSDIVQHWRLSAWEMGDQGMLGEGLIRALTPDLNADLNAAKMNAVMSKRGRPSAVFSPANEGDIWDEDVRKEIAGAYTKVVEAGSAAMVLSGSVKAEFPSYTPAEMQYAEARTLTRETVLAAFGVPPTRVGLPTANYATAREENKIYWGQLKGLARLIDAGLTRIARRFDPLLSVEHDFSGVDALQEGRDSRLNRVVTWTMLGATAADAAAYEGFADAPVVAAPTTQAAAKAVGDLAQKFWATPVSHLQLVRAIDPEAPRLEDSDYKQPPYSYVAALKSDYPEIWQAGGNIRGDEAFAYWGKYLSGTQTEGVLSWVVEREAWAARHYEDGDAFTGSTPETPTLSNIGGVVAWLKWGVVGQLGWPRIKSLIDTLKVNIDAQKSDLQPSQPEELPIFPEPSEEIDLIARETERTLIWRGWLDEVHTPAEQAMAISVKRALAAQAKAIADNLGSYEMPQEKDISGFLGGLVDAIFSKTAQDLMSWMVREAYSNGLRAAFRVASRQVGMALDVARVDPLAEQLLAVMVGNVNATTRDVLAQILADGIASGQTIAQMQARIQAAANFAPSRALLVARTETTRSTNAGASHAWQIAAGEGGMSIQREWLSSRDSEVRDAHRVLDGQTVELGGVFVIPTGEYAGKKASGPGDFDHPALVCNCRCTILPKVTK